jgi:hypothetical protein
MTRKRWSEYRRVYELILRATGRRNARPDLLAGDPIVPDVRPESAGSGPGARGDRYIDVEFEIDDVGKSHHIHILPTTVDPGRAAEKQLVQLIARSHFRPRVVDGRLASRAPVVVRYYFE